MPNSAGLSRADTDFFTIFAERLADSCLHRAFLNNHPRNSRKVDQQNLKEESATNKYAYIPFGLALTLSGMVHAADPVSLVKSSVSNPLVSETAQQADKSVVSPRSLTGDFSQNKTIPGDHFQKTANTGDHFTTEPAAIPGDHFAPRKR